MDTIAAAAASVGKGTLFRRFGDRDGLLRAVIEDRTLPLQRAIESGPPPLGPRTPPRWRLLAMLAAIVTIKLETVALSLPHESSTGSPYAMSGYRETHGLFTALLLQLGLDTVTDVEFAAHMLLAVTSADLIAPVLR